MIGLAQTTKRAKVFDPTLLGSTLKAWWDVSDPATRFQDAAGTTPATAAGQLLGKLNDKSGNGLHLTRLTSDTRRPTLAAYNGKYKASFDGTTDIMVTAATTALALNYPFVIGVYSTAIGGSDYAVSFGLYGGTTNYWELRSRISGTQLDVFLRTTSPREETYTAYRGSDPKVFALGNYPLGSMVPDLDFSEGVKLGWPASTAVIFSIGGKPDTGGVSAPQLAELMILDSAPDMITLGHLATYLKTKWGL